MGETGGRFPPLPARATGPRSSPGRPWPPPSGATCCASRPGRAGVGRRGQPRGGKTRRAVPPKIARRSASLRAAKCSRGSRSARPYPSRLADQAVVAPPHQALGAEGVEGPVQERRDRLRERERHPDGAGPRGELPQPVQLEVGVGEAGQLHHLAPAGPGRRLPVRGVDRAQVLHHHRHLRHGRQDRRPLLGGEGVQVAADRDRQPQAGGGPPDGQRVLAGRAGLRAQPQPARRSPAPPGPPAAPRRPGESSPPARCAPAGRGTGPAPAPGTCCRSSRRSAPGGRSGRRGAPSGRAGPPPARTRPAWRGRGCPPTPGHRRPRPRRRPAGPRRRGPSGPASARRLAAPAAAAPADRPAPRRVTEPSFRPAHAPSLPSSPPDPGPRWAARRRHGTPGRAACQLGVPPGLQHERHRGATEGAPGGHRRA